MVGRCFPAAIDHLAQQQALLGNRHRPRDRDDAKALRVAHHLLEDVGGLSQAPTAERRLAHGADEGVHAVGLAGIERRKRIQPVFVARAVETLVACFGHGQQV
jgi:hypothetical protein